MAVQEYTTTTRRAPFLEAAQESYIDLLTQGVGRAPGSAGVPTLAELGPTVAPVDPLTQAAQQQAATQAGLGQLSFDPTTGALTGVGTGTGVAGFQPFFEQAAAYSGPTAYQQFMSPYQQQVVDATLQEFDIQAQTLAQQAFEQQRGLASLQPSLAATSTQQLGAAGTSALAYSQALRDATQQQAQLAYQEPYTRLGILGSGIASQAGGVPTTTQTQAPAAPVASPLSQALQVGLTAYGLGSIFGGGN